MSDPAQADGQAEQSVLPVVARARPGFPGWTLVIAAGLAAVVLFSILNGRRQVSEAPAVSASDLNVSALPSSVPTLEIPPELEPTQPVASAPVPLAEQSNIPMGSPFGSAPIILNPVQAVPQIAPAMSSPQDQSAASQAMGSLASGPAVVIDTSTPNMGVAAPSPTNGTVAPGPAGMMASNARVRASKLADRSTTVTQGTLIHAVLETGFDSTRPGFARAVVSRDIRGFDGTRVLIPRGSRVIGEYGSDARAGQRRALIMWTRLIRPDGATIDIASPASDPVGRGGVKADVNSHFFERFSGAILQSALDVGVNLASRSANRSVVVALPNSNLIGSQIVQPTAVTPTLKVKPATSISIFVARDLDFTEAESAQ